MPRLTPYLLLAGLLPLALLAAPPQWDVRPMGGTQSSFRGFHPIIVDVETTEPLQGSILIRGTQGVGGKTHLPIAVGPGRYRYELAAYLPTQSYGGNTTVQVDLFSNGQRVSRPKELALMSENMQQRPTRLWGMVTPTSQQLLFGSVTQLISLNAVHPEEMPRDPWLLECVDAWMVSGKVWASLNPAQQSALTTFAKRGGLLITDTAFPLDQELPDFLGPDSGWSLARETQEATADIRLKARAPANWQQSAQAVTPVQFLQPDGSTAPVVNQDLSVPLLWRDATLRGVALPSESAWSLRTALGLGQLMVVGFDLQDFFKRHQGNPEEVALEPLLLGMEAYNRQTSNMEYNQVYYGGYATSDAGLLRAWTGLKNIPASIVLVYLALFAAVLGIGERLFLRHRGWLRFTWGTSLLLIVVFSACAALVSRVVRGTHSYHSAVLVRDHYASGGGADTGTDYLVPSRFRTYTAAAGNDVMWQQGGRTQRWWYQRRNASDFTIDWGSSELSTNTPVWSGANYAFRRTHDDAPMFRTEGDLLISRIPLDQIISYSSGKLWRWSGDETRTRWKKDPKAMALPDQEYRLKVLKTQHAHYAPETIHTDQLRELWISSVAMEAWTTPLEITTWSRYFPGHQAIPQLSTTEGSTQLVVGARETPPSPIWNFDRMRPKGLVLHRQIVPTTEVTPHD